MTHAVSTNGHGAGLTLVEPAPTTTRKFWVCVKSARATLHVGYGCTMWGGQRPNKGHEECGWFTQDSE